MIERMASIALALASSPLALFLYTFMAASLVVMLFIVVTHDRKQ